MNAKQIYKNKVSIKRINNKESSIKYQVSSIMNAIKYITDTVQREIGYLMPNEELQQKIIINDILFLMRPTLSTIITEGTDNERTITLTCLNTRENRHRYTQKRVQKVLKTLTIAETDTKTKPNKYRLISVDKHHNIVTPGYSYYPSTITFDIKVSPR